MLIFALAAVSGAACDEDASTEITEPEPDPDPEPQEPGDPNAYSSEHHDFVIDTVADGLAHPWGLAFIPGTEGDFLVTERPGRLRIFRDGSLVSDPIGGLPDVDAGGQGGSLDVALHPDFGSNGWVYISYSKGRDGGDRTTAVVRGRLAGDRLEEVVEIYEADAWTSEDPHFGSRLVFDSEGFLFISVGDRGQMDEAQELSNDQGSVLRLHDDGSIPADNPFVAEDGASGAIWTYGNRNVQGLAIHPETGELWASEHGPLGGDEINVLRGGANYGWPEVTYGLNYDGSEISPDTAREGMESPVHHWGESPAVSGLEIYDGDAFPAWQGDLFMGGLAGQEIVRLSFDGYAADETESLLADFEKRIRQVVQAPDGSLYVLVDHEDAPILRLRPSGS